MKDIKILVFVLYMYFPLIVNSQDELNKTTTIWEPYVDFTIDGSSSGNPFDEVAIVTFSHAESSTQIITEMFYNLNNEWKFRFTGTKIGNWTFFTSSSNESLNNIEGTVLVEPNTNPNAKGFVTNYKGKWSTTDNLNNVYNPQFVMYSSPLHFYQDEPQIDEDIQTFLVEHGFDGFHIPGSAYWFDLESVSAEEIINIHGNNPNPDVRVFDALEVLISKVHKTGKKVHFWLWGDETDHWTPTLLKGGLNGEADKRLLRYIAARLGPIPGWSMSYGFDVWRWATAEQVEKWHEYFHNHLDLDYSHPLGVRGGGNSAKDSEGNWMPSYDEQLNQLSENMDYSSYEQHKPSYNMYVETKNLRPTKPSFSEDRFRVRDKLLKDYNMTEVRRGLYHSTMAGGVANIWGVLLKDSPDPSRDRSEYKSEVFPNPEWINTYSNFFNNRFLSNYTIDNTFSNGHGFKDPSNTHFIIYSENVGQITFDLRSTTINLPVVAIDTKASYKEIKLGNLSQNQYTWHTPYTSDWIIAVGFFNPLDGSFSRDQNVVLDSLLVNEDNIFQINNFKAELDTLNFVTLSFITESEKNINKIELQRRLSSETNWSIIQEFNPNNESNVTRNYSYYDTDLLVDNEYQYRIRALFNDNKSLLSETKSILIEKFYGANILEIDNFYYNEEADSRIISLITSDEENLANIKLQKTNLPLIDWNTVSEFSPNNVKQQTSLYQFTEVNFSTDTSNLYRIVGVFNDGNILIPDSLIFIPNNQDYNNQFDISNFSYSISNDSINILITSKFEENVNGIELQKTEAASINWETVSTFEPNNNFTEINNYYFSLHNSVFTTDFLFRILIKYYDGETDSPDSLIFIEKQVEEAFNQIEIASFSAVKNFSSMEISLVTDYESNIALFDIQKSNINENDWSTVTLFDAKNLENQRVTYSYTETLDNPIIEYTYRVVTIFRNGYAEVSETVDNIESPQNFKLLQNYPNPFNGESIIEFSLPTEIITRIELYNSIGEHIETLKNDILPSGFHSVIIDGDKLASGVYIYTLQAGYFFDQKKFILLK